MTRLAALGSLLFLVLNDPAFSRVRMSGYVGNMKNIKKEKILKLDSGVMVEATLGVKGKNSGYELLTLYGDPIAVENETVGPTVRDQKTVKFKFKTPKNSRIRLKYTTKARSKKPSEQGWVNYLFIFDRHIELKLKAKTGITKGAQRAIKIQAYLENLEGEKIRYASSRVKVKITPPQGRNITLKLKDDGESFDGEAYDGVYGAVLKNAQYRGNYLIYATLVAAKENPPFERSARESIDLLAEFN